MQPNQKLIQPRKPEALHKRSKLEEVDQQKIILGFIFLGLLLKTKAINNNPAIPTSTLKTEKYCSVVARKFMRVYSN